MSEVLFEYECLVTKKFKKRFSRKLNEDELKKYRALVATQPFTDVSLDKFTYTEPVDISEEAAFEKKIREAEEVIIFSPV